MFVQVAESLSFTDAAKRLGVSKSTASKRVTELEEHLGLQLIQRTTRRMTLTEAGRRYFEVCRNALDALDAGEKEALTWNSTPQGILRVSVPTLLGQFMLGRVLEEYLRACPRVSVDLWLSDGPANTRDGEFDVIIRVEDASPARAFRSRQLFASSLVLCASPNYVVRHGSPEHPKGLLHHSLISYVNDDSALVWTLTQGDRRISLPVECRVRANSILVAMDATLAGLGIGQLPQALVRPHLADGSLVRVLSQWQGRRFTIKVLCGKKRPLPLRTKLFLDHLERNVNLEHSPLELARSSRAIRVAPR